MKMIKKMKMMKKRIDKMATQEEIKKLEKAREKALKRYREADRKLSEAKTAYIKAINKVIDTWREYREADDAYFEATKKVDKNGGI